MHPKRVNVLPERWLGKCHACHVGASSATGDWILFTDADCWLKPDVIARAIAIAEQENVDHVTLNPGCRAANPSCGSMAYRVLGFVGGLVCARESRQAERASGYRRI